MFIRQVIKSERMNFVKRIYVTLTDEEKDDLARIASERDATPGELLAAFAADLTRSGRRGGSDESMYADEWLCRQSYRWSEGKMIT